MYIIYGLNSLVMTEHIYRKCVGIRTSDLDVYTYAFHHIN